MVVAGTPPARERPYDILIRKSGGEKAAVARLRDLSRVMGTRIQPALDGFRPDQVLAAMALVKAGMTPESVSSALTWQEFEVFCSSLLMAHGYSITTNIVLTKPRRQIDIFAESGTLDLSVDCKHWGKSFSVSTLERVADSQIERTSLLKAKRSVKLPVLPIIMTLVDSETRAVNGVPVVPIFAARDFLSSVSRFDEGLAFV